MSTGIAEVFFGALVLAVFGLLLVISITFDQVIGDRRPPSAPKPTPNPSSRSVGPERARSRRGIEPSENLNRAEPEEQPVPID